MSALDDILNPVGKGTVLAPKDDNGVKPIAEVLQEQQENNQAPVQQKEGEGTVLAPAPPKPITFQGAIGQQTGGVQGTSPAPVSTPAPTTPEQPKQLSYVEMMEKMYPKTTEEDIKKEQKKLKREATMAMLSDGLAAFHNAYSHAKGTQPMPNIGGMSEKVRDRYEKRMKEFKDEQQKYTNAYINAQHMDDMLNATNRRLEADTRRQDRLDKETEIRQAKNEAYIKRVEAQNNKDYAMAAFYGAKYNALEEGKTMEQALKEADIALKRARAYQATEAGRLNGVRADQGGYSNSANGVGEYEVTEVKKDRRGNIVSQTTKSRKKVGGDGNKKKANPMGGGGKKSNPMK